MAVALRSGRRRAARRSASAAAAGPRYPAWLALPAVAWYAVFFLAPLAIMAVFSVAQRVGFSDIRYTFDLSNFEDLLDPLYLGVLLRTLGLATFGTVATLLVGFPLAYWIARHARRKSLLLLLLIIPFWTSFLIRTYAWLLILDDGFFVFEGVLYSPTAVYIGVVYTYLPLMVLPLYATLERLDWSLVDAAQDLGDGPLRAFRRVTLPLAMPGVAAGSLLVFIPMMGEYLNPVILGGDKTVYAGNLIAQQFLDSRDWPFGAAIAMVLIVGMTLVVLLYARLVSREDALAR